MSFQRALQTSDEGPLQNAKAPGWIRSLAELFAQLGLSPKRSQVQVNISEFICGNAQETKRAAGLEMHTHDVLTRINEKRPPVRPGKEDRKSTRLNSSHLG